MSELSLSQKHGEGIAPLIFRRFFKHRLAGIAIAVLAVLVGASVVALLNGLTSFAMNKLDILSGLPEVPVATAWRIDGKLTHEFPMTLEDVARAEAVYEAKPGWSEDITGVRSYAALPDNARRYVERIEALVSVPIDVISVGPDRDQTITRRKVF